MSVCVEKLPHSCGSRDGLQVFEEDGKYTGYCFSCGTYIPNPYEDKGEDYKPKRVGKSEEEKAAEMREIGTYQTLPLPDRGLTEETLTYFGVKTAVSETDGKTPIAVYFPYYNDDEKLVAYKARLLEEKRFWALGSLRDSEMFGWKEALQTGAKSIIICEGEYDAMSVYQMFKQKNKGTKWEKFEPAVVSVPSGAGSAVKSLSKVLKTLKDKFENVILCFDMDDTGRQAVSEVLKKVDGSFRTANLPVKDPNEGLLKGMSNRVINAIMFNHAEKKNSSLVRGSEIHEIAKVPPEYGFNWPWKSMTKTTRGARLGETVYFGAGVKMGKSEIVNTLAAWFIKEYNWKVFLAKPEEANAKTYKLVAGKLAGKNFADPDLEFDEEAYDKAGELLKENLFMLNLYQHIDWERLEGEIRNAASEGCKLIVIDPITNLTNGLSAADANTKLQDIAQKLSAMALDLNVLICIFCHLRNPDSGPPHDRGGEVLSYQFAGSRAMARSCNLMVGIEGNKDPSLTEEEKNRRKIIVIENRETGETGITTVYWNRYTTLFTEVPNE